MPNLTENDVPMVYPYLTDDADLRNKLIENKVFVAKYWPNVMGWCNENDIEYNLTKYLNPIPCDHRFGFIDYERVINQIE